MSRKHCFLWVFILCLGLIPGCRKQEEQAQAKALVTTLATAAAPGVAARPAAIPLTPQVVAPALLAAAPAINDAPIVLYCGRGEPLVGPLVDQFQSATGLKVTVKYADTPQLAQLIMEEGAQSPADIFWAQDASALGMLAKAGRLAPLDEAILKRVPAPFRHAQGLWVATSGRARVLAYSTERVKPEELPKSIFDLTDPKWKGRVGWAPSNASFKAFVTAMRRVEGQEKTRQWLIGMKANGAKSFPSNKPILGAIADGQVDLGLPNHYYLFGFKAEDPAFPVDQTVFADGDIGNMTNVAGIGLLKSSARGTAARQFIDFLLADQAQRYVTEKVFEYPVVEGVSANPALPDLGRLKERAPKVDFNEISDLAGTEALLREVGLL